MSVVRLSERGILSQSHDYECRVVPRIDVVGRWGKWKWEVIFKGEVVEWGYQKTLRKAEKEAENTAAQHQAEQRDRERQAQDALVASEGKTWKPWL